MKLKIQTKPYVVIEFHEDQAFVLNLADAVRIIFWNTWEQRSM